jgi:multisubunit Na+/H+ antiporter MnhB subunit
MKIKNKIKQSLFAGTTLNGFNIPDAGLPGGTLTAIVMTVANWLLWAIGLIGIIGFAIAGILYLTAAGDDDRISKAKNAMMYSIIGVLVALAGVVALTFARNLLGGNTL